MAELRSISLNADGSFTGWDINGGFVCSGPGLTIFDSLKARATGEKAPWMSLKDAYLVAAEYFNVTINEFNKDGSALRIRARVDKPRPK